MKNSIGFRKFSIDIATTLARQLGSGLIQLLIAIVIARLHGPEGSGVYTITMLLPLMLTTLMNMGVGPANVYFIGAGLIQPRDAWFKTLKLYAVLIIVGTVIGAVVITFFAHYWFPGIKAALLWLALIVFPFSLLLSFIASFFQGLQQFKKYNIIILLQPISTLAAIALLYFMGERDLESLVIATIFGVVLSLFFALRQLLPIIKAGRDDNKREAPSLLSYGFKAHLGNIITFANYKADLILVNYFIGPIGAGVYVVAMQFSEKLWLFSGAVSTVLLPKLSELSSNEEEKTALTPIVCRGVLVLTGLASLLLVALAEPVVRIMFGPAFYGAVPVLYALTPGIILWAGGRVLANDVASRGKPEFNLYISLVVLTTNLLGNLILIPSFGLLGAAIATSLAYLVDFILKLVVYVRFTGNDWIRVVFVQGDDFRMIKSFFDKRRSAHKK